MSYTKDLAEFTAQTTYQDLPAPVIEIAKIVFLDSLICGIAAKNFERSKMMHTIVNHLGGPEQSTVLGLPKRVAAPNAVMANTEIMNLLDADDTFFSSSHFAVFNVAAALAVGESEHASGKSAILATVLGFDVNARINLSLKIIDFADGQFKWATINGMGFASLGTAVSAGSVYGLNPEQMLNNFGLAGWFAPGPATARSARQTQWFTMKYSPYSQIAMAGVLAAVFAKNGYLCDQSILDGEDGFWKMQGSVSTDQTLLTEDLGKKWWIEETAIKFYPSCRYTAAPIDMMQKLIAQEKLTADDIEHIEVRLNPMALALPMFKNPARRIDASDHRSPLNAEFNIPYVMALTALGIQPGPRWHQPEMYGNPDVINFMQRVITTPDPAAVEETTRALREERIGRFRKSGGSIIVKARGKEYVMKTDYSRGDPWTPETHITWESLDEKFHNFCGDMLTEDQIKQLTGDVRNMDEIKDISHLLDCIR
ncbi:MAG: MmgE/PrpD family protein [Dehalococcoidales bacterium]|nr:MmgE/PrpD family protein [Dehalococcoidales bacterium]